MNHKSQPTITSLAERSSGSVMFCTLFFAMGGTALFVYSSFTSIELFWAVWIPFCFLSIPALHQLSRELIQVKARLADLEARLDSIQAAEQAPSSNGG